MLPGENESVIFAIICAQPRQKGANALMETPSMMFGEKASESVDVLFNLETAFSLKRV